MKIRKIPIFILLLVGLYLACQEVGFRLPESGSEQKSSAGSYGGFEVYQAYQNRQSNVQVNGQGEIVKILSDDNKGRRHQKFIVRVPGGITVLIAHNIDLAPRIFPIAEGDQIAFFGEYEWNTKGGVVHWTHRDPSGRHPAGWLQYRGQRYQ